VNIARSLSSRVLISRIDRESKSYFLRGLPRGICLFPPAQTMIESNINIVHNRKTRNFNSAIKSSTKINVSLMSDAKPTDIHAGDADNRDGSERIERSKDV